jgi:hypothetical protein
MGNAGDSVFLQESGLFGPECAIESGSSESFVILLEFHSLLDSDFLVSD